ncbi:MAG: PAS domain S-box protein [Anaeromyxobacter sp.]|nr:PAS domain S-box protein [Anaeromyxobacter sp.]MBL0278605.1 PAS domain S-box protein [Anaeromyxobacter sp.]
MSASAHARRPPDASNGPAPSRGPDVASRSVLVVGAAVLAYVVAQAGLAYHLAAAAPDGAVPALGWYLGGAALGLVLLAGVAWREARRLALRLRRSQLELHESEERFRLAFKTSPEPLTLTRLDTGVLVACNDGFLKLHGLEESQVVGRRTVDLGLWVDPAEREAVRQAVERGEVVSARDVRVRGAAGDVRILAFSASAQVSGGVRHMLALGRDVTEERAAAARHEALSTALRQSEARYRSVVRSVPLVQWAIGTDDRFTLSEGRGLAGLGLAPGQVVGRTVQEVYAAHPGVLADYQRAKAGETFMALNDFGSVAFESHWAPLRDEAGRIIGVTGIALDVTARRKAEAQLLQAQKMDAVGRLASGIAHDFNNLLVVILGGCDYLQTQPGLPAGVTAMAGDMAEAGQRAATLVRQLLAFGRKGRAEPRPCTLNAVVAGFERLLRRTISENIAVEVRLVEAPFTVRIDTQQLEQVLLNLAVNARDAMPGGGTLRISTSNQDDPAGGGRWACLTVADTGTGMEPEVRAHLFEPFFTTKGTRGTGLGLATVFGIVQQAGGRLEVESAPGRGSTFHALFQAVDVAADDLVPEAPAAEVRGAGQLVLVVEDEPGVRRSTVRMLGECGFQTLEAEGAEEALQLAQAPGVALVITDVVMPGMPGTALASCLAELRPGLPVLFATGYMDRHLHEVPPQALVLEKPFTREALGRMVMAALRSPD